MNTKNNFFRALLLLTLIAVQGFAPAAVFASPLGQSATSSTPMPADLYRAVLNSTTTSAQNNSTLSTSNGTYPFNMDGLNASLSSSGLTSPHRRETLGTGTYRSTASDTAQTWEPSPPQTAVVARNYFLYSCNILLICLMAPHRQVVLDGQHRTIRTCNSHRRHRT